MEWITLRLWDDEQKRIQECLSNALCQLIKSKKVSVTDGELVISGKLRPYLYSSKKILKLQWTLHVEASCFSDEDDPKPIGHPDIRFSLTTPDFEQYNYDVECKLVRIKRKNKSWDYCEQYVSEGIKRFEDGKYAQSLPPMGTMIGYVQECKEISGLLDEINNHIQTYGLQRIEDKSKLRNGEISHLIQDMERKGDKFILYHQWADLR